MSKYRVYGDKLFSYYIDVEAISAEEAWDIASNAATTDWVQMETDSVIEVSSVDNESEDITPPVYYSENELEDGYPSMDNDILISDKSDI